MKKNILLIVATLLLAASCNSSSSQSNSQSNFGDEYKNIVSFLQSNKLQAAVVQKLTASHESFIILVKSDGSTQTLDKWTDKGNGPDMDYPGMPPIDQRGAKSGYPVNTALSSDGNILWYIKYSYGNFKSPDSHSKADQHSINVSSLLQLNNKSSVDENILKNIDPKFKNLTFPTLCDDFALSPSNKYFVYQSAQTPVESNFAKNPAYKLTLYSVDASHYQPADHILNTNVLTKINNINQWPDSVCELAWSMDSNFLIISDKPVTYDKNGFRTFQPDSGTSKIYVYDLRNQNSSVILDSYPNEAGQKIISVISPNKFVVGKATGTYSVDINNNTMSQTQILNSDTKLVGLVN